jgi:hypothetical protein
VIYLSLHDSKKFREAKARVEKDDEWFTRFMPFERFLHFLVVASFLLLVITGMPLKFYHTDWAETLFALIGGVETARTLQLRCGRHVPLLRPARRLAHRQGLEIPQGPHRALVRLPVLRRRHAALPAHHLRHSQAADPSLMESARPGLR